MTRLRYGPLPVSLAIEHARRSIEAQRVWLNAGDTHKARRGNFIS